MGRLILAPPATSRSDRRIALWWGCAEAILFFVIPDVFLSYAAVRRGWRRGLVLCLWATIGAIGGGLIVYGWGALDYGSTAATMQHLPAIDGPMIATVYDEVAGDGLVATLRGPLRGQPYKLYAAAAGSLGLHPIGLVLITIPARIVRFMLSAFAAGWLRQRTEQWISERTALGVWAAFWVVVYTGFWFA